MKYLISEETLEKVLDALVANSTSSDGEEEWNNDDVIEAETALRKEMQEAQSCQYRQE